MRKAKQKDARKRTLEALVERREASATGTQFTSFTSTKVQMLTQTHTHAATDVVAFEVQAEMDLQLEARVYEGTQFNCFTSAKVQILTQRVRSQSGICETKHAGRCSAAGAAAGNPQRQRQAQ